MFSPKLGAKRGIVGAGVWNSGKLIILEVVVSAFIYLVITNGAVIYSVHRLDMTVYFAEIY